MNLFLYNFTSLFRSKAYVWSSHLCHPFIQHWKRGQCQQIDQCKKGKTERQSLGIMQFVFFMIHVYWVRGKKREHFFFSHPVKLTHRLKHEKFGNLISLHKYCRLHLFKQYLLFFLQIDLQHFVNPEETCHYLLIIAGMFGLVNQVN